MQFHFVEVMDEVLELALVPARAASIAASA
jgi:hypothetical protein